MFAFVKDSFLPLSEASIPITDRCFLLGDGIFETILYENKNIVFFPEHYDRLKGSADFLKIPCDINKHDLLKLCTELIGKNKLSDKTASIRVTLSRGESQRGIAIPSEQKPTLVITATAYHSVEKQVSLFSVPTRRNELSPLSSIKNTNYLEQIIAREHAVENGFDDALILNTKGHVAETSVANIFFISQDGVVTPSLATGILPGIMRSKIIKLCQKNAIPCIERTVDSEHISAFLGAFQTNCLIKVQFISRIDDNEFSFGQDCPYYNQIKHLVDTASFLPG